MKMSEEASRKMLEEASRKMLTKKCWNIYKMLKKMFATFLKNVGEKILKKLLIKNKKSQSVWDFWDLNMLYGLFLGNVGFIVHLLIHLPEARCLDKSPLPWKTTCG
jgi:hypothetical protein